MTRYRSLINDSNAKWWTLGAMCFALGRREPTAAAAAA